MVSPQMSTIYSGNTNYPAWFPVAEAARYSGLSRALIYEHIADGALVTSTVKRPARTRGRRLVQRASLDHLIEEGIGEKSADNTGRNSRPQ
jgi:hypothetical protein